MNRYYKQIRNHQETIIYVIIWLFVAVLPFVIEVWENINGKAFDWKHIQIWCFRKN